MGTLSKARSMITTMITKTLSQSLKGQGGTITALLSIVRGVIFGSLLRNFCDLRQEEIIWIALPGELFMRMLSCLSMPLVLPKLVTAIGSLDPKSGGKILGKVLLFYASVNIVIEITGILTFYAINSTNSSKTDIVLNNNHSNDVLPTSFFIHDLLFNLVPENIATAPFQRYVTKMGDNNGTVTYNDATADSNNILGLVVAATSVGMVLAQLGESGKPLLEVCSSVSAVTSLMMEIVIKWVCPPGLFSLVASQILILQNPAESLKDVTMFVITVVADITMEDIEIFWAAEYDNDNNDIDKFVKACEFAPIRIVRKMINNGVDVNGYNTDIVTLLLSHPDIDLGKTTTDDKYNGLHAGCQNNSVECVKLFLRHPKCNSDIVTSRDVDGNSAEIIANEEGNHECVRLVREFLDRDQQLPTQEGMEYESQEVKFEEDEDFDIDDDTEENNFEYIEDSDGEDDTISLFTAAPAA